MTNAAVPDELRAPVATWLGFSAMCLGMFMAVLDIQVVATSLPAIRSALDISADLMSWVQTAYLIAEVIAIPLTGLLTRALTMRVLFAAAVGTFTVASIGCALSAGFVSLIAWRVVQGFSGGMLIPLVFSAVFLLFPFRLQGFATTLAGMLAVLAPTIGPAMVVVALLTGSLLTGALFVIRSLHTAQPVVDLRTFRERGFSVGCTLSFLLGMGLYGSVYLMPVFLAFVRDHGPLAIGVVMLVTGITQFVTSPIAVALERRINARALTFVGFLVFGIGLSMSAFATRETDFDGMFWPQVVRGAAIMLCLLPPTRIALGELTAEQVPDASGLFNLMRNLGGAIGIALIDTVIWGRSPIHAEALQQRLIAGDASAGELIGLPPGVISGPIPTPVDPMIAQMVQPLVEKVALVQAINEAWAMLGAAVLTGCILCLIVRRQDVYKAPVRSPVL